MFHGNGGFILDVEEGVVLHDNGCLMAAGKR